LQQVNNFKLRKTYSKILWTLGDRPKKQIFAGAVVSAGGAF